MASVINKRTQSTGASSRATVSSADKAIRDLVQVARLLSDETRLRILFFLAEHEELYVSDLCERLELSQPAVSHHLALLRVSGLIDARREGKHNYYSLQPEAFAELLTHLFSAMGEEPRKIKLHGFTLNVPAR